MFNLLIALAWGFVTVSAIILREPVPWWLYAIATAALTIQFAVTYILEGNNG